MTNGSRLHIELRDKQSPWARRLRDLLALMVSDLGGCENCSEAEKSLVRRASMLTLQLELIEQKWAQSGGEASDKSLITYQRVANSLRRILESIGLKRRSRDITPSLTDYLRQRQEEHGAEEE
ncbi:hypothetical protein [Bradyrhizobium yuanmingense]|uniref:hypothetical protein n=1 Tax=Bradyrhizobium yuanmingense TaxID=108015 RepID=UPI0023B8C021|nr:hypothetical protein [Bradyrhizobium yuanmingense]MDF0583307.1 hypothetical protein [Bradyrhizobium yuanmingense]